MCLGLFNKEEIDGPESSKNAKYNSILLIKNDRHSLPERLKWKDTINISNLVQICHNLDHVSTVPHLPLRVYADGFLCLQLHTVGSSALLWISFHLPSYLTEISKDVD